MDWQSEYLREKAEKDKLYVACGKLNEQMHELEIEIIELKYGKE